MLDSAFSGLLTCLSLIVAIGAQNAYLLRQGLRRSHVGTVVAVCTLSDYALMLAGVSGVGAIVAHSGWALVAVRWLGAAFLTWYGLSTAWRALGRAALGSAALRPAALRAATGLPATVRAGEPPKDAGRGHVVRRAVALTWLNPHVYLDSVLLIGSVAATHGPSGRWWFAVGACAASTIWFVSVGFGARLLAPVLASPRAWQVLDLLIAVTMLVIAVKLASA